MTDGAIAPAACGLSAAALLHDLARAGSQAVVATPSPIVAATPGASILELGARGIRAAQPARLDLVSHWRGFINDSDSYFRHLLDG